MIRRASLLTITLGLFLLVACGGGSGATKEGQDTTTPTTEGVVSTSTPTSAASKGTGERIDGGRLVQLFVDPPTPGPTPHHRCHLGQNHHRSLRGTGNHRTQPADSARPGREMGQRAPTARSTPSTCAETPNSTMANRSPPRMSAGPWSVPPTHSPNLPWRTSTWAISWELRTNSTATPRPYRGSGSSMNIPSS